MRLPLSFAVALAVAAPASAQTPGRPAQVRTGDALRATTPATSTSGRRAPNADPRRIWADVEQADVGSGTPSPDGRFYSYVDWDACDVAIRDLEQRTTRRLGLPSNNCEQDVAFVLFSPDGKQIAYQWHERDSTGAFEELRVTASDTARVRSLIRVPSSPGGVLPRAWTPDGKSIVYIMLHGNGPPQIAMVPTSGGTPRTLKTFLEWHQPYSIRMSVSPDGKFIAYSYPSARVSHRSSIGLLSTVDGRDIPLFTEVADEYVVGWAPSGASLVFASDRGGSPGLWSVVLSNGKPTSSPKLLRGDMWRMTARGLTERGDLIYTVATGDRDIFVANVDLTTGHVRSKPVGITKAPGLPHGHPAWSPDGRFIAYTTEATHAGASSTITIRSVDAAETREFRPNTGYVRALTWMPDSRALLIAGTDLNGRHALQRLDLRTGELAPFIRSFRGAPVFSRDGRSMYYMAADVPMESKFLLRSTDRSRLMARELATGKEEVLYTPPEGFVVFGSGALGPLFLTSPDGQSIIVPIARGEGFDKNFEMRLVRVDARDRTSQEIFAPAPGDSLAGFRALGFSSDQRNVVMFRSRMTMPTPSLWTIPIRGGAVTLVGPGPENLNNMLFSPSGRQALFPKGTVTQEMWVLEDAGLQKTASSARR